MSTDASPGPGWWLASDGKWYPPEAEPGGWWSAADQRWYPTQPHPPPPPGATQSPSEARLRRRYWLFAGLAWFATFSGFFSAQNGDPATLVGGIYGLALAVGFALAGVILGIRVVRSVEEGADSLPQRLGRVIGVPFLGLLTVMLLAIFVGVMTNATWGGIEVETDDIAWWFGLTSVGGVALGLLLGADTWTQTPKTGSSAPVSARRRDWLAIVALVVGILAIAVPIVVPALVALTFGLLSIRRAQRDARPRSDMAVAGSVLGVLGLLAVIPLLAEPADVPYTRDAVLRVQAGDCVDVNLERAVLRIVSCRALHDGEVYGVVEQRADPEAAYPGTAELISAGDEACRQPFSEYLGVEREGSDLDSIVLPPRPQEWATGSRRLVCIAWYSDGTKLVEPVGGTER